MQEQGIRLNLGCGNKRRAGFVGVDKYPADAVDVIADIAEKIPYEADSVAEIWMDNVIEHIFDIPKLMREVHRVACHDALITVATPHFTSISSWRDPTHLHHLSFSRCITSASWMSGTIRVRAFMSRRCI